MWINIGKHISAVTGIPFTVESSHAVGGGSINSAYVITDQDRQFFVKTNAVSRLDMFQAELEGLNEIANTDTIKVPSALCVGVADGHAYIVMECLDIQGTRGGNAAGLDRLGADIAQMHQNTAKHFGWHRDNTIGSTPQINNMSQNWVEFFRQYRLGFQYDLAARNGFGQLLAKGEKLMSKLDGFFTDYKPEPSLLHGDLWSGNYAIDDSGAPVIFDPAVYYGDREADIAMTELFGGFSSRFYASYNRHFSLDPGYKTRKILYNLYHILNHVNLFGGGYMSQAERMAGQLLSELY